MIVFDIDGTVLPGTSCERLFMRYLIKRKIVRLPQLINFCRQAIALLPQGLPFTTKANKGYLRHFDAARIATIGEEFFISDVISGISLKGVERIKEHQEAGERVMLFSGMPDFLLRNFSEYLHVPEHYGSIMEIRNARFTGRTLGPFPLAAGKVKALEKIIAGNYSEAALASNATANSHNDPNVDWSRITFYGDHWLDRFLMQKVGNPVVVNPKEKLRALAIQNSWPVEEFRLD